MLRRILGLGFVVVNHHLVALVAFALHKWIIMKAEAGIVAVWLTETHYFVARIGVNPRVGGQCFSAPVVSLGWA